MATAGSVTVPARDRRAAGWWGNRRMAMLLMLACIAGLGATPLLIAPAGPAPAARAVQVTLLGTGLCCGAQHPALSGLVEKWTLPSERRWVSAVDALSCVAGSLLNCLVIAQLARLVQEEPQVAERLARLALAWQASLPRGRLPNRTV